MKVGPSLASQRPQVPLPTEIIAQIITCLPSSAAGQHSAWACCLVSHQWYSAAISKLYQAPRLGPNFDKFTATLCPPIHTHARRIGLELLVKHLDMSRVAYESSNSLTARLLRRVGPNLEVFIAPSTSFSTSSLAPLSKCKNLRRLDLRLTQTHRTSSSPGTNIYDLLRSIRNLDNLRVLSFPPLRWLYLDSDNVRMAMVQWPRNLTHLRLSGTLPRTTGWWQEIASRWPETLTSLEFQDCGDSTPMMYWGVENIVFPRIDSLRISGDRLNPHDDHLMYATLRLFPYLRFLSLPALLIGKQSPWCEGSRNMSLERLEITLSSSDDSVNFSTLPLLSDLASGMELLWQIRLHESYAEDDIREDCQIVDTLLKKRAKERNEAAGHVICEPEDAGIILFE